MWIRDVSWKQLHTKSTLLLELNINCVLESLTFYEIVREEIGFFVIFSLIHNMISLG